MNVKRCKKNGVKNPFCPKTARLYRYRLVVYQYRLASAPFCITCTGTHIPICHFFSFFFLIFFFFFLFIYIFLQIGNSSVDVKSILVDCFPSRVSLHAHLSFCLYSAQLIVFTGLITIFPSLDTFNLSMGPTVFLVIRVPRVQTNLAT